MRNIKMQRTTRRPKRSRSNSILTGQILFIENEYGFALAPQFILRRFILKC
jgi:hypothetical protein